MKKILALLLVVVLLLALPVVRAFADNCDSSRQILGDEFTLASGETLDSTLIVFGGNVTIDDGAEAECDIVIYGGNVDIAGEVKGSITAFGGNLILRDTAEVSGALTTVGGALTREDGAVVEGGVSQGFSANTPRFVSNPLIVFLVAVIGAGVWALLAALTALAVTALMPQPTARVSAAVSGAFIPSLLLGLLSLVALPIVLVIVTLTICLSPLALVGGALYGLGLVFGWVAVGHAFGMQVARALKLYTASPVVWATGGTFVLTLFTQLLGLFTRFGDVLSQYGGGWMVAVVSCGAGLFSFVLAALGLGAVMLTRFGAQPYLSSAVTPAPGGEAAV
jgi:hypothetical protein